MVGEKSSAEERKVFWRERSEEAGGERRGHTTISSGSNIIVERAQVMCQRYTWEARRAEFDKGSVELRCDNEDAGNLLDKELFVERSNDEMVW